MYSDKIRRTLPSGLLMNSGFSYESGAILSGGLVIAFLEPGEILIANQWSGPT